jgi:hypothetical protein
MPRAGMRKKALILASFLKTAKKGKLKCHGRRWTLKSFISLHKGSNTVPTSPTKIELELLT